MLCYIICQQISRQIRIKIIWKVYQIARYIEKGAFYYFPAGDLLWDFAHSFTAGVIFSVAPTDLARTSTLSSVCAILVSHLSATTAVDGNKVAE